jgi:hypothetical protein
MAFPQKKAYSPNVGLKANNKCLIRLKANNKCLIRLKAKYYPTDHLARHLVLLDRKLLHTFKISPQSSLLLEAQRN